MWSPRGGAGGGGIRVADAQEFRALPCLPRMGERRRSAGLRLRPRQRGPRRYAHHRRMAPGARGPTGGAGVRAVRGSGR